MSSKINYCLLLSKNEKIKPQKKNEKESFESFLLSKEGIENICLRVQFSFITLLFEENNVFSFEKKNGIGIFFMRNQSVF